MRAPEHNQIVALAVSRDRLRDLRVLSVDSRVEAIAELAAEVVREQGLLGDVCEAELSMELWRQALAT